MSSKTCRITYADKEILLSLGSDNASRKISPNDVDRFTGWIDMYNELLKQSSDGFNRSEQEKALLGLGREIYQWLNGDRNCLAEALEGASPCIIELCIPKRASDVQRAFIEVPWELLADDKGFLAQDQAVKYCPVRRIGTHSGEMPKPSTYRLSTVFMAASPRDVKPELNYEREESAILGVTHANTMDVFVEESGNPELLIDLVNELSPDIVHLSCHGSLYSTAGVTLCLEDETGHLLRTDAEKFCQLYSQNRPALTFLSACNTAQVNSLEKLEGQSTVGSFAHRLIENGFRAVLSWSGSVSDTEATRFASVLYRELSNKARLEDATALARWQLFVPPADAPAHYRLQDWHLARLYLATDGGGKLIEGRDIRFPHRQDSGHKEFLGKKEKGLKVAARKEFVGRRRQVQDILGFFRDNNKAGVLVHGLGNQGKSSLAARIANRLHNSDTLLIYGGKGDERQYTAPHILEELGRLANHDPMELEQLIDGYRQAVGDDHSHLRIALKKLLEGPFSGRDAAHRAVYMVVDDLEKILVMPEGNTSTHSVHADYRKTLIALIRAFAEANTESRLLITSRYTFDLIDDDGKDIANYLERLALHAMNASESTRQYWLKYGDRNNSDIDPKRVMTACRGNPGLQDMLFALANENMQLFLTTLEDMEAYIAGGEMPQEEKIQSFLQGLALDTIFGILSDGEKDLLRYAIRFDMPLPNAVFAMLYQKLCKSGGGFPDRLVGLGLLELYDDFVDDSHKALKINAITAGRLHAVDDKVFRLFAQPTIAILLDAWHNKERKRSWQCDLQLNTLALIAEDTDTIARCATIAIWGLDERMLAREAFAMAVKSVDLLERDEKDVPPGLHRIAADICHRAGEVDRAQSYLETALSNPDENTFDQALSRLSLARTLNQQGKIDNALEHLEQARQAFESLDASRETSIVIGDIARILVDKGEVDKALALHRERIQVFEQLGDSRSKAVTQGDIASILVNKGEVDKALALHRERIQVFEQLGDSRSKAVTQGYIARILVNKGEVDKALALHRERIQVFEQLGDSRSKAVTQGYIARILVNKGEVDKALALHRERIQVFEQLGDSRSKAVTQGDIARILVNKGEVDKALALHQEELCLYEQLGDSRSKAVTQGYIARILVNKGEVDKALALHQEELCLYEQLGDSRSKAVTQGDIARILVNKGEVDKALALHQEELCLYEQLGDSRSKAVTQGDIARILVDKGEVDKALALHRERIQVFEQLGDSRSKAVTQGDIARILVNKGEVDKAILLQEQRLEINKELGDLDGQAIAQWDIAQVLLNKERDIEKASQCLVESYQIFLHIGRLDGISMVGMLLGQLLLQVGNKEEGLAVLNRSKAGFEKLQQPEMVTQVQAMIDHFSGDDDNSRG